jgi:hypothetical membrane protein
MSGLRCGIISPILWLAVLGAAMLARPGFSPITDYISELGEAGSTTEFFVRYAGFELTGLLYVVFAIAAGVLLLNDAGAAHPPPQSRPTGDAGAAHAPARSQPTDDAGAAAVPAQSRATRGLWTVIAALLVALDGVGRFGAGVYPCDLGCESVSTTQALHRLFATVGFCSGVLAALAWGVVARRHPWLRGFANASTGAGLLTTALLLLMTWGANPYPLTGLYEHLATVVISVWTLALAVRLVRRVAETADATRQAVSRSAARVR